MKEKLKLEVQFRNFSNDNYVRVGTSAKKSLTDFGFKTDLEDTLTKNHLKLTMRVGILLQLKLNRVMAKKVRWSNMKWSNTK